MSSFKDRNTWIKKAVFLRSLRRLMNDINYFGLETQTEII